MGFADGSQSAQSLSSVSVSQEAPSGLGCYCDLSPSFLVDQMWHLHILDVVNYCHDMMMLCGHVVGHNPDGALDIEAKRERDSKTRDGLEEHFEGEYDKEIWGIIESPAAIKSANDESTAEANPNVNTVTDKTVTKDDAGAASTQRGSGVVSNDEDGMGANANNESDTDESCMPGLVNIEISLRFTGFVTKYRVHRSTRLSGYFRAFARSQGKEQKDFVFRFNGLKIDGRKTFHSLKTNSVDTLHLVATDKDRLVIRIRDQSGEETFFAVKESTRMAKIFNSYALRKGIDERALRFFIDGEQIQSEQTPRELDLEDGDVIDVMLAQSGC